jgi:hypothetical protein
MLGRGSNPRNQSLIDLGLAPRHLLRGAGLADELLLLFDAVPNSSLGDFQGLEHLALGNLQGATLDHDNRVGRPADHEVDGGELQLLERGVQDPVPFHPANPDRAERTVPGHLGKRKGG